MTFRNRLKYWLVKNLRVSNKEAEVLVAEGRILIDGNQIESSHIVLPENEITFDGKIIKPKQIFKYIAYHKPVGIETTLNTEIADNLVEALRINVRLFPVGRLDKASEGLLLLTNNGQIFDKILRASQQKEKEYLVEVNKPLTEKILMALRTGIMIMGQMTLPAKVFQESETSFRIILTQGLNRQIRRMCYKFDYEVLMLKRIRIMNIELGNLEVGTWRELSDNEIGGLL